LAALAAVAIILFSCGDEKSTEPDVELLNENIHGLSRIEQPAPHDPVTVGDEFTETEASEGKTYVCSVQEWSAAPEFSEQLALNPTTDVIWPGAIVDGATIVTGEYIPITLPRGPLTFSTSLANLEGNPSRTVENPKLSTVRQAMSEILNQNVTGETPAFVTFRVENVYSERQLDLALGASMTAGKAGIKSQFNFSNRSVKTRILVSFMQVYYTLDIDIPEEPCDFFASSVSWKQLKGQMAGDVSPMFVSTVAYGRLAMFALESRYEATEVGRALEMTIPKLQLGVDVDAQYASILNNSTIKATIIGGSGTDAVGAIDGVEGLRNYILQGGKYDRESPAAPIAYKLRYMCDYGICNMVLASNYFVKQCHELKPGSIGVYNNGAYVARFYVSYLDGNGERITKGSGNFPVLQMRFVDVPEGASDINLHVQKMTWWFLGWEEWGTIFRCSYPWPSNCCYTVDGTTVSSNYYLDPSKCPDMDSWECDCS
jgi:thiol-activated cytolysin